MDEERAVEIAGEAVEVGEEPLRRFRVTLGLSVEALAAASGVPAERIAGKEAGRKGLTFAECEALGAALGVPPDLLEE